MKIKLVIVLSLLIYAGISANAAEIKILEDSCRVAITENVESESDAVLIVMKSGEEIDNVDEMYAIWDTVPQNGVCTWEFSMPENNMGKISDGEYDLYIKQDGKTLKKDKMIYATLISRNRIAESFKAVLSEEDFIEIIKSEDNFYALKVSGFAMDLFVNSGDENKILKNVYERIDDFSSVSKIANAFNFGVVVDELNKDRNVKKCLEIINPQFEDSKFSNIDDEKLVSWICMMMEEGGLYKEEQDITKMYEIANMLYIINNSRVTLIESNFDKYAVKLGINLSDEYAKYLDINDKYEVNKKICEGFKENPAHNSRGILDIIKEAIGDDDKPITSGRTEGGYRGKQNGITIAIPSVDSGQNNIISNSGNVRFEDMNGVLWAQEAVNKLVELGIISGDGDGNFRPNDNITREEFVKMLVLATGKYNENSECDFSDTHEGAWHYKYIASAYESGIVNGISDTKFGTGTLLTRQDMALLCRRSMTGFENKREAVIFVDDYMISDYAKEAVYDLYKSGVINGVGDNLFSPKNFATRAQCAKIIFSLLSK